MWHPAHIADLAAASLQAHANTLRLEQTSRGIDSLPETALHPILADGLAAHGLGVACEFPYPGPLQRRFSSRERCDLVLTPSPEIAIADPVAELIQSEAAAATLFSSLPAPLPPTPTIPPEDAFWLEIKLVGQFCFTHGVPGPNSAYASELLHVARSDIPKLARDPRIRHGALLIILFTADRPTADHDLSIFLHKCLDKDLPISSPSHARFPIPDLIGNSFCTLSITPITPCR